MYVAEWLLLGNIAFAFIFFVLNIAKLSVCRYLGIICVISFISYNITMPSKINIRVDWFITFPVTLIVLAMMIEKISKINKVKKRNL